MCRLKRCGVAFGNVCCLRTQSVSSGTPSVLTCGLPPWQAPALCWAVAGGLGGLLLRDQLLAVRTGAPISHVSGSLIRLYLRSPPASHGLALLLCFPSSCRTFSSFTARLSRSVINTFKAVNPPPTPADTGSTGVRPLPPCGRLSRPLSLLSEPKLPRRGAWDFPTAWLLF